MQKRPAVYEPVPRGVRSFATQVVTQMWVPGKIQYVTTTGTTPVYATAAISMLDPTTNTLNWSTKFAAVFEEYRVIESRVDLIPIQISNGNLWYFIDEGVSTTLTTTTGPLAIQEKNCKVFGINCLQMPGKQMQSIHWKNRDFKDDQFTAVGSQPAGSSTFKLYADSTLTTLGSSGTPVVNLQPFYLIQFRGFVGA